MLDGSWPFDTGNQIWAPIAGGDLDGDGNIELVVVSKSKHAFILDAQGNVILDFETDEFLISSPAIGNLDEDDELEIAFASMNSGFVYAINMDGSPVHENFPLELDEKVYADIALADFNHNGLDDIVVATSSNDGYVFVILDDGNIAEGFPFFVDDKFRSAPLIIDAYGVNEHQILIGNDNGNLYCISEIGQLIFNVHTDDKIRSAPSTNGVDIFISNEGNHLYSINRMGAINNGWPFEGGNTLHSPVFADMDLNGMNEILTISTSGDVIILDNNGNINTDYSMSIAYQIDDCPPAISDVDNDGDLELVAGMTSGLHVIDFKPDGYASEWNIHRGNPQRTGYWSTPFLPEINLGDVNFDSELNVLDVVFVVNSILEIETLSSVEFYIADMNADGIVNVLDILEIVIILMS
jgi:outer membrane protein assembly factor BamB